MDFFIAVFALTFSVLGGITILTGLVLFAAPQLIKDQPVNITTLMSIMAVFFGVVFLFFSFILYDNRVHLLKPQPQQEIHR